MPMRGCRRAQEGEDALRDKVVGPLHGLFQAHP